MYSPGYFMPIPQFLDHCHVNFSYTLSFTPGYSILLSQDHMLHHSKIPEINVQSRFLHADTKIPGSLPSQLLLYIILHPRLFDASVTNHTLHQSNIPEFDVATVQVTPCQYHNSWINAVPSFPTHYPLHPKILDAAVTRPMVMPVKFP